MVQLTRSRLPHSLLLLVAVVYVHTAVARPIVPTAFAPVRAYKLRVKKARKSVPPHRRRKFGKVIDETGLDTAPPSSPGGGILHLSRYDNLVSGVAEISMGFSIGVLWSEYAIIATGCGPLAFSDTLERLCYQGVILAAGGSVFSRIAFGKGLVPLCEENFGYLENATLWQVHAAEILSLLAAAGAFVALGSQIINGERMDGLSGIDVEMCGALRDL